jgi:hypothetical protein
MARGLATAGIRALLGRSGMDDDEGRPPTVLQYSRHGRDA